MLVLILNWLSLTWRPLLVRFSKHMQEFMINLSWSETRRFIFVHSQWDSSPHGKHTVKVNAPIARSKGWRKWNISSETASMWTSEKNSYIHSFFFFSIGLVTLSKQKCWTPLATNMIIPAMMHVFIIRFATTKWSSSLLSLCVIVHDAAGRDHLKIVKYLLQQGADVHCKNKGSVLTKKLHLSLRVNFCLLSWSRLEKRHFVWLPKLVIWRW